MRILVVGGGPAGLCFARSLQRMGSHHSILVVDQMQTADVGGWGITLSPEMFSQVGEVGLRDTYCKLNYFSISLEDEEFLRTPIDVYAISRQLIVDSLAAECATLGVAFRFGERFRCLSHSDFDEFDLVVAADGANSTVRSCFQESFGTQLVTSSIYHAWFSTAQPFGPHLRRILRGHRGGLFCASAYQFSDALSTFIVECTASGRERAELATLSDSEAIALVSSIFADDLGHNPVMVRERVQWRRFALVRNTRWFDRNVVLVGDAAHTAHFSKGFGTVIAIRDALSLASHLSSCDDLGSALSAYEQERVPRLSTLQAQGEQGREWYERLMSLYENDSISAVRGVLTETEKFVAASSVGLTRP